MMSFGLTSESVSYPRPSRPMVPGLKFSTRISAHSAMRLARAVASGPFLRLRVMPSFSLLHSANKPERLSPWILSLYGG